RAIVEGGRSGSARNRRARSRFFPNPTLSLFALSGRIQEERPRGIFVSPSYRLLRTLRRQLRDIDAASRSTGPCGRRLSRRRVQRNGPLLSRAAIRYPCMV